MKKRLLSLALCLALCLGLLPVGVLALEEAVPSEDSNADYVASVTTSDGKSTSYTTLTDAVGALNNGDTLMLLNDVDVGDNGVSITKNITFDLGGKTLSSSTESCKNILTLSATAVTVKNGSIVANGNDARAIYTGHATGLTLENITATAPSGGTGVMLSGGGGSTATIKSGTYQGLYVGENMNVTLEGGTFNPCSDQYSIFRKLDSSCNNTSRDCMELLGAGYSYVDANNNPVRTFGGFNQTVTVTKNVEIPSTPVAKVGDTEYPSLREAIAAAKNGGTITLLHDLDLGNGAMLLENSGSFTLDLNQHRLHASGSDYLVFVRFHRGNVSLINGTLDGSACSSTYGAISVYGANFTMTLNNITAVGGTVTNWKNQKIAIPVIVSTSGSTVIFDGGVYTGGIQISNNGSNAGNIVLKSGTFQKGTNDYSIKTEDSGKHLSDYLDESLFWNGDTVLDLSSETQTADEVTVRPCEHKWENGKCTVCQKVCDHGSADGKSMTEDPCPTCGMKAAAQVDITGSDAKYFPSFTDALVYATKNNGCTLKLLADVTGTTVQINNPFIFDLNGHSVDALSVDAKATIKDSGTTKGRIGKVTVSDTKVPGLTLGDLLEEGYAFKYGNGYWANDSYLQTTGGSFVTVEKAPIQSVNVYAKDKNNQKILTIAYGATGEVTLVSSCKLSETSGENLSCAWYKLTDDTAIPPLEGAAGTSYKLPADLPAGTYTYRVTFTSDYYSKSAEITITVTPISLVGAEVTVQNPTYNGNEQGPEVTVKLGDKTLGKDNDYNMKVTKHIYAGSYQLTINGGGNYTGTATSNWKITPKTVTNPTIKLSSGPFTYTGQKIEPTVTVMDEGKTIPDSEYTVSYESNINAGTAKIIITDKENGNYTVSGNTTFTIDKAQATCTPPTANDLTYNGTAQQLFGPGSTQDGTLVYSMYRNGGYVKYGDFCATSAKNYTIWYKVMGDSNHTISEVNSITVTIKPAPLTVTAKDRSAYVGSAVPTLPTELVENTDYTVTGLFKEDKLTKTPKLSYVATPDMSKVGEFVVNISEADAGSNYTITYVPGKLTITTRPSSGGSGNTGTKTDTVKNPDGSTTKTETKADGSKTETTTASSGGGSTGTTVTKTDAKGNTTTEASAKLSDRDVKEAQEKGEAVTVPVKGIAAAKDANAATKIKIDVPNNANKTTVEIPVENVTSGTVAVIVHEDGTEELVKDSKPTEHGVQLELSGSTTVKIIDNSKTFDDTKDHWSRDEVNFVAARELFNGVGGNQFGVSQPMTRGMVNTVLARLAGVDTTPGQGQAWYEVGTDWAKKNGISDGTNPTAPVTREQLATLLYRYAGSPSVSGTLHAADAASVSDYAEDALLWANQNGIVNGVGSNTIAPKDNAQRAQVAAMLARYLQNQ